MKEEKQKKCEFCCPNCDSRNVNWDVSYSIGDGLQEQPGECEDCGCKFAEVVELTYLYTKY